MPSLSRHIALACILAMQCSAMNAQSIEIIDQQLPNPQNIPAPCHPLPNQRQLDWQDVEFYAFFHYGMNTFTDREWGFGNEEESIFAPPTVPDCEQWVKAAKACGMKGGIAVVKHHDGFCLWPTATTDHNVTRGSLAAPQVNIPRQFAEASEKLGMRYGFYISPWDRNSAHYGTDRYVTDVFFKQVDEISTIAGNNQFEMWFDGANGGDGYYGGVNETRAIDASIYYDRPNLYDHIHHLQPNCTVWGDAGEARWIGNEQGFGYETQWSTNDPGGPYAGLVEGWTWYPTESDAKATDRGWFWHNDETPLTAERMYQMYLETVGRNATLILNMPPNNQGVLPKATIQSCKEMGKLIKKRLSKNLAAGKPVTASATRSGNFGAHNMLDSDANTYWATDDSITGGIDIIIDLKAPKDIHYVMLQEYIKLGQRVKKFSVATSIDGEQWTTSPALTTTIGHKRIVPLANNTTDYEANRTRARYVKVTIDESRACPLISNIAVY